MIHDELRRARLSSRSLHRANGREIGSARKQSWIIVHVKYHWYIISIYKLRENEAEVKYPRRGRSLVLNDAGRLFSKNIIAVMCRILNCNVQWAAISSCHSFFTLVCLSRTHLISSRCSGRERRIDLEIRKLSLWFSSLDCRILNRWVWVGVSDKLNSKVAENLHHRQHAQPPRRQKRFQGSYTGHTRAKCTQVIIGRGREEDELGLNSRYSCKASSSWAKTSFGSM